MQTVEEIAKEIVGREGGFVNDLDDPGGATKHGVTIHTMRRLGLDLTGDGAVGEMIVGHPDIDKIAFTGSTAVGRAIRKATAGSGIPKVGAPERSDMELRKLP